MITAIVSLIGMCATLGGTIGTATGIGAALGTAIGAGAGLCVGIFVAQQDNWEDYLPSHPSYSI